MTTEWKRLPRERAIKTVKAITAGKDSIVFSEEMTEVTCQSLPFYKHYDLYRLTNYATMPSFSMTYLGDGLNFYPLDGTTDNIYKVNEVAPIALNQSMIILYLDFFFANIRGADGDVFLIKDPNDMPFMPSLSIGQKQSIINSHHALRVNAHVSVGHFTVTGTLYYNGTLSSASIDIRKPGIVSIGERKLLLQGVHFPQSPTRTHWGISK